MGKLRKTNITKKKNSNNFSEKCEIKKPHEICSTKLGIKEQNLSRNVEIRSANAKSQVHKNGKEQSLRKRMLNRLKAAQFRFLNEKLYLAEEKDFTEIFVKRPSTFEAYHSGYRQQVSQWPVNPLEVIIESLQKRVNEKESVIADFGCGEALLAKTLTKATVHSFDLVASNEMVTACDMRHTNLPSNCVDIAVFCLSLMGQNISEYLREANRILKPGGLMKIAEVESRFENIEEFIKDLKKYGFSLIYKNFSYNLFYFIDFKKETCIGKKQRKKLPSLSLKPCLYKKR